MEYHLLGNGCCASAKSPHAITCSSHSLCNRSQVFATSNSRNTAAKVLSARTRRRFRSWGTQSESEPERACAEPSKPPQDGTEALAGIHGSTLPGAAPKTESAGKLRRVNHAVTVEIVVRGVGRYAKMRPRDCIDTTRDRQSGSILQHDEGRLGSWTEVSVGLNA